MDRLRHSDPAHPHRSKRNAQRGALEWIYAPKLFGGSGDRHTGYIRAGYGTPGTPSWRAMAQEMPLGVIPRGEEVEPQLFTADPGCNYFDDDCGGS